MRAHFVDSVVAVISGALVPVEAISVHLVRHSRTIHTILMWLGDDAMRVMQVNLLDLCQRHPPIRSNLNTQPSKGRRRTETRTAGKFGFSISSIKLTTKFIKTRQLLRKALDLEMFGQMEGLRATFEIGEPVNNDNK